MRPPSFDGMTMDAPIEPTESRQATPPPATTTPRTRNPRASTRPFVASGRRPAPPTPPPPPRWRHRQMVPLNENLDGADLPKPQPFARGSTYELAVPAVPEPPRVARPSAGRGLSPPPYYSPVDHGWSPDERTAVGHASSTDLPNASFAPPHASRHHAFSDSRHHERTSAMHLPHHEPVDPRHYEHVEQQHRDPIVRPHYEPVEQQHHEPVVQQRHHEPVERASSARHYEPVVARHYEPVERAVEMPPPIVARRIPPPLPPPALVARGSAPPGHFGGPRPSLASDLAASSVATFSGSWPSLPEPPPSTRRRTRRLGETIGIRLTQLSLVAVVATVTVAGVRMWREAKQPPPVIPSAVIGGGDGLLELSADRQTLVRIDHGKPRWTARQTRPLDEVSLAAPLVLGRAGDALSALELDSGRARFEWTVPAGERWGVQPPAALGSCLLVITTRGGNALAHCIDITTGAATWTATIAGGRECVAPPIAIPGAYLMQCPGFTTVIDDRDGTVSFDAGGLGLVQREPPLLLRAGPHPLLAAWSPKTHKFARTGTPIRGTIETASSVVQHGPRLVVRAMSASDKLVTLASKTAAPVAVTQPDLQLADNTPLVLDCGGEDSPRFQLLELAPKVGEKFDPAAAQHRVLALLDVEAGRVAWTSRPLVPVRRAGQATAPICTRGHYFVPIDTGGGATALWIIDAETGTTTSALAFDLEAGATFADLAIDQIDRERIVGVDRTGAFELDWRKPIDRPGLHDARGELARVLGHLP